MIRSLIAMVSLALALSGCTFTTDALPNSAGSIAVPASPAAGTGLGKTLIDDKGVAIAYAAIDAATTLVDLAIDAGRLKPRTPIAIRIADGLDRVRKLVNGADALQRAGQADAYAQALSDAEAGVRDIVAAVKGTPL